MDTWCDRNYRSLMLWGMVVEILLIGILVVQGWRHNEQPVHAAPYPCYVVDRSGQHEIPCVAQP